MSFKPLITRVPEFAVNINGLMESHDHTYPKGVLHIKAKEVAFI